jgi:hypothetical protein
VVLPAVRHGTRPAGVVPAGEAGEGRGDMRADAGTLEEVLGPLRGLLAELKAARKAAGKFVDPGTWAEKDFVPTPVLQLLERLTYLLGLSDLEREFFAAGAAREAPHAWDGLSAYADWLEDRGNEAGAARVRTLTPRPGDVLVFHYTGPRTKEHDIAYAASRLADVLAARGCVVTWSVAPPGVTVEAISEHDMARYGWVRATRVAEEREACAGIAEEEGCERTPARIRRREGKAT